MSSLALSAAAKLLRRYLERGGALLVLIDPRAKTDLVDRVRAWGVDVVDTGTGRLRYVPA